MSLKPRACTACTFIPSHPDAVVCEVCGAKLPAPVNQAADLSALTSSNFLTGGFGAVPQLHPTQATAPASVPPPTVHAPHAVANRLPAAREPLLASDSSESSSSRHIGPMQPWPPSIIQHSRPNPVPHQTPQVNTHAYPYSQQGHTVYPGYQQPSHMAPLPPGANPYLAQPSYYPPPQHVNVNCQRCSTVLSVANNAPNVVCTKCHLVITIAGIAPTPAEAARLSAELRRQRLVTPAGAPNQTQSPLALGAGDTPIAGTAAPVGQASQASSQSQRLDQTKQYGCPKCLLLMTPDLSDCIDCGSKLRYFSATERLANPDIPVDEANLAAACADELPLPPFWERRTTAAGVPYYVDHKNRTTTWDHPGIPAAIQEGRFKSAKAATTSPSPSPQSVTSSSASTTTSVSSNALSSQATIAAAFAAAKAKTHSQSPPPERSQEETQVAKTEPQPSSTASTPNNSLALLRTAALTTITEYRTAEQEIAKLRSQLAEAEANLATQRRRALTRATLWRDAANRQGVASSSSSEQEIYDSTEILAFVAEFDLPNYEAKTQAAAQEGPNEAKVAAQGSATKMEPTHAEAPTSANLTATPVHQPPPVPQPMMHAPLPTLPLPSPPSQHSPEPLSQTSSSPSPVHAPPSHPQVEAAHPQQPVYYPPQSSYVAPPSQWTESYFHQVAALPQPPTGYPQAQYQPQPQSQQPIPYQSHQPGAPTQLQAQPRGEVQLQ